MSRAKKIELTPEGKQEFEAELRKLKDEDRPRNLEALKDARAQGDLSENADYDSARDEQARIEERIKELENILANATIISSKPSSSPDEVGLGKLVKVKYFGDVKPPFDQFVIVSSIEADLTAKPFVKMSAESPFGLAVLTTVEEEHQDDKGKTKKVLRGLLVGERGSWRIRDGREIEFEIVSVSDARTASE